MRKSYAGEAMTTYSYYYESGYVYDESPDLWALIEMAVKDAVDCDQLHALRVGPMRDAQIHDYFNEIVARELLSEARLTALTIVELVNCLHADTVHEGEASTDAAGLRAFDVAMLRCESDDERIRAAVEWAEAHIELDPPRYCDGSDPLPIEYHEGEWIPGGNDDDMPAVITYAAKPGPGGHIGWVWWALGKMGNASTLADAMRACADEIGRQT
jgi:hypothetical protein